MKKLVVVITATAMMYMQTKYQHLLTKHLLTNNLLTKNLLMNNLFTKNPMAGIKDQELKLCALVRLKNSLFNKSKCITDYFMYSSYSQIVTPELLKKVIIWNKS